MRQPVPVAVPSNESVTGECIRNVGNNQLDEETIAVHTFEHDPLYHALAKYLLKTGKGRRPALPALPPLPTIKILQILQKLKDMGSATWEDVAQWFKLLYPEQQVSMGRLVYRIEKLTENAHLDLDAQVDFDEVAEVLSKVGLTRSILLANSPDFYFKDSQLSNEFVFALEQFRSKEALPLSFLVFWLQKFLKIRSIEMSPYQIKSKVNAICKAVKNLQKRKAKDELEEFFSKSTFYDISTNMSVPNTPKAKQSSCECKTIISQLNKKCYVLETNLRKCEEFSNNQKIIIDALREERDALLPLRQDVQAANDKNSILAAELKDLKEQIKAQAVELSGMKATKTYKQNSKLKSTVELLEQTITELKKDALRLKTDAAIEVKEKNDQIQLLKNKVKVEQTVKSRYKVMNESNSMALKDLLLSEEDKAPILKEKKFNQFSDDVRLMYMSLIGEANVAAQNCAKIIQIVSKHLFKTDIPLDKLPCPSTALNIASEAFHVSQHHVATKLKDCEHFTFASDGTSRDKKHYLERHVILNDKTEMSLGFTEIAVDDSVTLLEKTIEILDDLSDNLCKTSTEDVENNQEKKQEQFLDLLKKLKCTMSDRSSVNKSFNQKLSEYKQDLLNGEDASTHFLYCNAHFLLGLVVATEIALKSSEHDMGKLGRDQDEKFDSFSNSSETATFRLIRLAAEVFGPRGDEKSGCRREWVAYLDSIGKKSKFTSFRSNRFNNTFENASAIIHHKDDMVSFLTDYISHSNKKLESILQDLADGRVVALVQSVALFNILFTGPYWALMNSHTSYAHFPQYVSKMKKFLDMCCDKNEVTDVFSLGSVFSDFVVATQYLCNHESCSTADINVVTSSFRAIAEQSNVVLERQLKDFLKGGVFGEAISPEIMSILKTCPLTNLTGERLFGDLDFDMHKRRHASLHLRTTLNMWKRNKTSKWVVGLKSAKAKKLLDDARKYAAPLKAKSKERSKNVTELIQKKLQENMRTKKDKVISKMTYETALLDAIIGQGGLCTTQAELDELVAKPNALANLKTQVRYRKIVKGENILIGGNLETLYSRLCVYLGFERTELPLVGSVKRKRNY